MKIFTFRHTLILSAIFGLSACGSSDSNNAPEFDNTTYTFTVTEDESLESSVSATDADGDTLTYTLASSANNGTVELNSDGSFTYTPDTNFAGEDTASIAATDGKLSVTTSLAFTVENVNDAPVINTTSLTVSAQGASTGTIDVSDADGDEITFAIVSQPENGVVTIDSSSGDFTYTPDDLELVDGSFVVSYTDGVIAEPIEAEISLSPSFTTNADKLNYYYSSDFSHLKQAEAMFKNIGDDEALNKAKTALAVGYIAAGFSEQAKTVLATVTTLDTQARGYRSIAKKLDEFGEHDTADDYRATSLSLFNQYLAEKGIDNFSKDDAEFFTGLFNDYDAAGNAEAATSVVSSLIIYADAINEETYISTFAQVVATVWINVSDLQEQYFATGDEDDRQLALNTTKLLWQLAGNIGYRTISSGEFEGDKNYNLRVLYITRVAEHFFNLKEDELAKQAMADAFAVYGVSGYDSDYIVEAYESGPATLDAYSAFVENLAGLFAYYYPDAESNLALDMLEEGTANYIDAVTFTYIYEAVLIAEVNGDVASALVTAKTYFEENGDLRDYYEFLIQYGADIDSRLAGFLANRGFTDALEVVLAEGLTVLQNADYIMEESARYTLGSYGCAGLTKLYDREELDAAVPAQTCMSIFNNYYLPSQSNVTNGTTVDGYDFVLKTLALAQDSENVSNFAASAGDITGALESDYDTIELYALSSSTLASYGFAEVAVEHAENVFTLVTELLDTVEGQTEDAIDNMMGNYFDLNGSGSLTDSFYNVYDTKTGLRQHISETEDFSSLFSLFQTQLEASLTALTNASAALTVNEQQNLISDLITLNANAGLYAEAEELVVSDVNELAEEYEFFAALSTIVAEQDDFPGILVANVDTDNDGLVNFFLLDASEEEITASELIADEDSDNDGVTDIEDLAPLNAAE